MTTKAEKLAALEDAIDEGVLSVTFNGRTITYRSLQEMEQIRDRLIKSADSASRGPDVLKPQFSKGY